MGLFTRLGLAAVLLATAAAGPASPVAALLSDPVAAAAYDYPALRDRLGLAEFGQLSLDTNTAIDAAKARRPYPCDTVSEAWVRMGFLSTFATPDAGVQRADWKAATVAVQQSRAERARLKTQGEDGAEVRSALADAAQASDPRLKILFQRYAEDQAVRLSWSPVRTLAGQAQATAFGVLAAENCAVDGDNVAWLKRQIAEHGWFDSARYGVKAANAAFMIAQHADGDPAFQRSVLPLITADSDPRIRPDLAMLTDRVAKAEQRPQVYGTQGQCKGPGVWEMDPVTDPEGLDERRKAMGLPPLATYRPVVAQRCG
jgi:hypothetical protein